MGYQNIKRYFRGYFDRILCANEINKIDNNYRPPIDSVDERYSKLINQGYFVEKNFLPENLRKELLFNYLNKKGYFLETNLKLFEFIKSHYSNIINNYLGKEAVLCNYTYIESKGENQISGDWHTDNLGRKLNFMICLEGYGNCPTYYLPKSHEKKYFPSLKEELRSFSYNNNRQEKIYGSTRIDYFSNDVAMFDGNGLHRGGYESTNKNKKRITLIIDFVDINKIYNLGFKRIPNILFFICKKYPFRKKNFEEIKQKRIDKDILKDFMNFSFIREEFVLKEGLDYYYSW